MFTSETALKQLGKITVESSEKTTKSEGVFPYFLTKKSAVLVKMLVKAPQALISCPLLVIVLLSALIFISFCHGLTKHAERRKQKRFRYFPNRFYFCLLLSYVSFSGVFRGRVLVKMLVVLLVRGHVCTFGC